MNFYELYPELDIEEIARKLVEERSIYLTSLRVYDRPDMEDWGADAKHYKVTLRRASLRKKERSMTLFFSQGSAHTAPPKVEDVIYCLVSDGNVEDYSFEEFCSEYGYDQDSRKAERVYKACVAQAKKFDRFLED